MSLEPFPFDEQGGRTAFDRFVEEPVGVVVLTSDRDEEFSWMDRPGIDARSHEGRVGRARGLLASGPLFDCAALKGDESHLPPRCFNACWASSRSSNGNFFVPMIW